MAHGSIPRSLLLIPLCLALSTSTVHAKVESGANAAGQLSHQPAIGRVADAVALRPPPRELDSRSAHAGPRDKDHLDESEQEGNITVHYTTDCTAHGNNNCATQAEAEEVLEYYDLARDQLVSSWGYAEPFSNDDGEYHVYLMDLNGLWGEQVALNELADPGEPGHPGRYSESYIDTVRAINFADEKLFGIVVHEYFHSIQTGYVTDTPANGLPGAAWVIEGSAAWMAYQVRRAYGPQFTGTATWDDPGMLGCLFDHQTHPWIGLPGLNTAGSTDGAYRYAGCIWPWFLSENTNSGDLSGTGNSIHIMRNFWEAMAPPRSWDQEIESFDQVLSNSGVAGYDSFDAAFAHFITANLFTGDWYPSRDAASADLTFQNAQAQQIDLSAITYPASFASTAWTPAATTDHTLPPPPVVNTFDVGRYGAFYLHMDPGGFRATYQVNFDGDDNTSFIVKMVTRRSGAFETEHILLNGGSDALSSCWWLDPRIDRDGFIVVGRLSAGGTGSYTITLDLCDRAPIADAGGPYTLNEGSSIQLDGTGSSDPDGDTLTYNWSPAAILDNPGSPTPTFSGNDDFAGTLTLTVRDPFGMRDDDTAQVNVLNVPPTLAGLTAPVGVQPLGDSISLSASFSDPGTLDTHTATWDWGDATMEAASLTESNGSGSITGSHTYLSPGPYTITLTVTDDDGGTASASAEVQVDLSPDTPGVIETRRETAFLNLTGSLGTLGSAEWGWREHVGAPQRYWIHVNNTGEWMFFFHVTPNDLPVFDPDRPEDVWSNRLAVAVPKASFQGWFWCGIPLYDRYYRFQGYGCHPDWGPVPYGAGDFHPWYQARIEQSEGHIAEILRATYSP